MQNNSSESNADKNIHAACNRCTSKLCQKLHFDAIVVSPDPFAVPHNCPMQTQDQFIITSALHRLSDFDVSRIASTVWTRHHYTSRPFYPGHPKVQEIQQILSQLRRRECVIIAKMANPWYKPWTLFGFWAKSYTSGGMIPIAQKEEEPLATNAAQMSEQTAEQKPFEIKAAGMEHLEEGLQKEHYRKVAQGDKVKLLAEVDGANEGESIKFELYYSTDNGGSTHFDTVSGKITDGIGSAEWTVDLTKPLKVSDTFELKHEPVVRGKYGKPCSIGRRTEVYRCDFVQIPDVLFHLDSAVPCIDAEGSLIAALTAALKFASDNPEKEVVLFGHTDVSGKEEYNFDLSADRSAAIKAILDNDETAWADITKRKSKDKDYQQILKTLSGRHGWPCDPGAVDGEPGTSAGIEAFQREYNSRFSGNLAVDGTIGPKTWKALFAVTRSILETEAKKAISSDTLPKLTYGYEGKGLYPCGESFPLEGVPGTDAKNRRVELCFFDKGKASKLLEHKDKAAKVTTEENPVYDKKRTEKTIIEPVVTSAEEDRWIIFEETAEKIDPDFPYEMSLAQPPQNRWFYVFGSADGSKYSQVWEIRTDDSGKKYATYLITEGNCESRPEQEPWEDVAFLPGQNPDGSAMRLVACVSDVRLPKERIFGKEYGLLIDPSKRCVVIDDPKQAVKKQLAGGQENIVLLNQLLHAELLRKKFDDAYSKWEQSRSASWLEKDDSKKKEKLLYEFGALVVRIIEAYPDYRQHLAPGQYPKLYDQVKAYDEKKVRLTTDITNRVDALCRFIDGEMFSETCRDYTSLIRTGSEQSKEFYAFEDRVGAIVEDITRFPQGAEVIKGLIRSVKSQTEHSWLQDLLLLKNDVWSVTGSAGIDDSRPGMSGEKRNQNWRKLGDGAIKLFLEGAKSGVGVYKPQELASILEKVFATTGESVKAGLVQVPMSPEGIRPFQKVLGSFDKGSFWRIELKGNYENMFTNGPVKTGIDKFLLGLEGIALLYSVKDHLEKNSQGKAGNLDHANITVKLITYFAKSEMIKVPYKGELVKIGKGPLAVANGLSSLIDTATSFNTAMKRLDNFDYDSFVWNSIATAGYLTSTAGYGVMVATFYAGAAASSSTGIGIAPGLLLAFTGAIIAIGGKLLAADADNTPLENMLLKTPWGIHPEIPESTVTSAGLQKQYIGAMRLINSFKVSIDHDTMIATLHLRRLESTTAITMHEVTFGIPTRADGSSSTSHVVGTGIKLTDNNCEVIENAAAGTVDVRISLAKVCSGVAPFLQQWKSYYDSFGKEPRPDYIKLQLTVDLDGDGIMVLPDERKKLCAEKYYGQKVKTTII